MVASSPPRNNLNSSILDAYKRVGVCQEWNAPSMSCPSGRSLETKVQTLGTCLDDRIWETPEQKVQAELCEPRKPSCFRFYWLLNRDPYKG